MDTAEATRKIRLLRAKAEGTDVETEAATYRDLATKLQAKYGVSDEALVESAADAEGGLFGGLFNWSYRDAMYPFVERVEAALAEAMIEVNKMDDLHQRVSAAAMLYGHLRGMLDGTGSYQAGYFPLKYLRNDALLAYYEAAREQMLRSDYEIHQELMPNEPWDGEYAARRAEDWARHRVRSVGDIQRETTVRNLLADARHRAGSSYRMVSRNFETWKQRWLDPERKTWTQRARGA